MSEAEAAAKALEEMADELNAGCGDDHNDRCLYYLVGFQCTCGVRLRERAQEIRNG